MGLMMADEEVIAGSWYETVPQSIGEGNGGTEHDSDNDY